MYHHFLLWRRGERGVRKGTGGRGESRKSGAEYKLLFLSKDTKSPSIHQWNHQMNGNKDQREGGRETGKGGGKERKTKKDDGQDKDS